MAALTPSISEAIESASQRELKKLHWADFSALPELACDHCWDTHCIFEAVITRIDRSVRNPEIAFDILRTFNDAPRESISPIVQASFLSEDKSPHDLVSMRVGECFVMFCLRDISHSSYSRHRLFVERAKGDAKTAALLQQLTTIARLRSLRPRESDLLEALRASAFDPDPIISEYSLRQLLESGDLSAKAIDVARLQNMADDSAIKAPVRLLAAQIAFTIRTGRTYSDAECEWLWQAFKTSPLADTAELRSFAARIWQFPHDRADKVVRLLKTVDNAELASSIRLVACHPLLEEVAFHYREPDEWSDRIFQSILRLLSDRAEDVHTTAAGLAAGLVLRCRSPRRRKYHEAAAEAVKMALARETNDVERFLLRMHLDKLDAADAPPANMKKMSQEHE